MKEIQAKLTSLILVCGLMFGCGAPSTSPLVAALHGIGFAATGAAISAPLLADNGVISTDDATLVITVAMETSKAVPLAITEAQSADTNPVKLQAILMDFAPAMNIVIGSTVSPQAASIIHGIQAAIQALLAQLGAPAIRKLAAAHPTKGLVFTRADKAEFSKLEKEAKDTQTKAAAWISAHPKK